MRDLWKWMHPLSKVCMVVLIINLIFVTGVLVALFFGLDRPISLYCSCTSIGIAVFGLVGVLIGNALNMRKIRNILKDM